MHQLLNGPFKTIDFGLALIVKLIAGGALIYFYTHIHTVRDTADIFKYFDDSAFTYELLKSDGKLFWQHFFGLVDASSAANTPHLKYTQHWSHPGNHWLYMSNRIMITIHTLIRPLSGGTIVLHSIVFNLISLGGFILLAKSVNAKRWLFWLVLLLPNIAFWTSGMLKEAMVLLPLGLFFWSWFKLNHRLGKLVLLISSLVFTFLLKPFIAFALIGGCLVQFIHQKFGSRVVIDVLITCILAFTVGAYFKIGLMTKISQPIIERNQMFQELIQTESVECYTDLRLVYPLDIIKNLVKALKDVVVCPIQCWPYGALFKISAIEQLIIIGLFICALFYHRKQFNTISILMISVAILMYVIIGLTVPVSGGVLRYRIPANLILLFAILSRITICKNKYL